MKRPALLDDTLALVADRLGLELAEIEGRVERVDVHARRGVTLELFGPGDSGAGTRVWFRGDGQSISQLNPQQDRDLPLCSTLLADDVPVAWRPGRRVVLSHFDPSLLRKGYRKGRLEAPRLAHEVFFNASQGSQSLSTPRVVETDLELSAITFARIKGREVRVVPESGELFFALGEGLARVQDALRDAPLPVFGIEDELSVLEAWSEKVLLARGYLPAGWRDLADVVADSADSLAVVPRVGAHRDLHDGQLLDVDGLPSLIDFDLACLADPCLDPANLLAHLELRLLQGLSKATRSGVDACAEALLEGLGSPKAEAWQRLRFYQATAFLRLALVYAIRPRWRHLSSPLVSYAKRCLGDLVRSA